MQRTASSYLSTCNCKQHAIEINLFIENYVFMLISQREKKQYFIIMFVLFSLIIVQNFIFFKTVLY